MNRSHPEPHSGAVLPAINLAAPETAREKLPALSGTLETAKILDAMHAELASFYRVGALPWAFDTQPDPRAAFEQTEQAIDAAAAAGDCDALADAIADHVSVWRSITVRFRERH